MFYRTATHRAPWSYRVTLLNRASMDHTRDRDGGEGSGLLSHNNNNSRLTTCACESSLRVQRGAGAHMSNGETFDQNGLQTAGYRLQVTTAPPRFCGILWTFL